MKTSLQLVLCLLVSSHYSLDLLVDEGNGEDERTCVSGAGKKCKSLQYLSGLIRAEGITFNITITIHYSRISSLSQFENISRLTITGTARCDKLEAGISFYNITDLSISGFDIKGCLGIQPRTEQYVVLYIERCSNVLIEDIEFTRCRETAILFNDTHGNVSLNNIRFTRNKNLQTSDQNGSYSGGMEVLFHTDSASSGVVGATYYEIRSCVFSHNTAPTEYAKFSTSNTHHSEWRGQSIGGGLAVHFQGNASNVAIIIENCTFEANTAIWGGGLHVLYQHQVTGNSVEVHNSKFLTNRAKVGGGGVCVRYFKSRSELEYLSESHPNTITFENVEFYNNTGKFGGGMAMLSVYSDFPPDFLVMFRRCNWTENTATFSSAVEISPALFQRLDAGNLPTPEFSTCTFQSNSILIDDTNTFYYQFSGAFGISKSRVLFSRKTKFVNNSNSALLISSGSAVFKQGSNVLLADNSGSRGGAISAHGYTSLVLHNDTFFNFTHNHASELGAGIYYLSYDQFDFSSGRECFIKLASSDDSLAAIAENNNNNITMLFDSNWSEVVGTSIYASTLYPCFFKYNHELKEKRANLSRHIFDSIGHFNFDDNDVALATIGRELGLQSPHIHSIPGELMNLQLSYIDDLNRNSSQFTSALLVNFENGRIKSDRRYTIEGEMRLFGTPETTDNLQIILESPRRTVLNINTTLLECPPGFVLAATNAGLACRCSTHPNSNTSSFFGIAKCDSETFHAFLLHGYWIGYIPETKQTHKNLYASYCPLSFCKLGGHLNRLPKSGSELSESVCSENRRGILCGQCKEGFSPFYHSSNFQCGSNSLCSFGVVFYFLSEVAPVIVFFTVIITLGFSITSGNINGFIFFCQILDSLSIDEVIKSKTLHMISIPSRLLYDIFNLDYFSITLLSFCLWKDAAVIDLLAFKYVTVLFAFALVVFLILIMNCVKCSRIEERLEMKNRLSVINGLSAFLIICYAECAQTSFNILTPVKLRTQGGTNGHLVAFFGGLAFFEGRHLFYAIVAVLVIAIVVAIPPFYLLIYPALPHLLALCNVSEHWIVGKLLSILQVYRLKPLIDSFQGCYKDRLRFFAGLYFLYRILILACRNIASSLSEFHLISQFLLIIFMGIHSIVQPYKKRPHNILDSFMFLNLLLINGCNIFIDVYIESFFGGSQYFVLVCQEILLSLPALCFIVWLIIRMIKVARKFCTKASSYGLIASQSSKTCLHSPLSIDNGILRNVDYYEMTRLAHKRGQKSRSN